MRKKFVRHSSLFIILCSLFIVHCSLFARPIPNPALRERLKDRIDVIGIVHWGPNTYTDREWGYGDEDPSKLNPIAFNAEQIVGAAADGGLKGLVVVAKHHDGFCLWPTKTTEHNISKSPFRGGKGDYVREMERACRKFGLKFGVYISPWDRNNADYATDRYVDTYHQQIKELLGGEYGEVFEMWFDGANGGDGYYGGKREKRKIKKGYYRFDEVFAFCRELQPNVTFFGGAEDGEFVWPGNERGMLDPNLCASSEKHFHVFEADFPLRPGWFYHAKQNGRTKNSAYLLQRYLGTVGNAGIMNIGLAPMPNGLLAAEDCRALRGFRQLKDALFSREVIMDNAPYNIVVMEEDVTNGEQVEKWQLLGDANSDGKRAVLAEGKNIGFSRIRCFNRPVLPHDCKLETTAANGAKPSIAIRRYLADKELLKFVMSATTESGETDTAKWMLKAR